MASHDDYPFASSYQDRHGKTRWRFRRSGKTVSLPGGPGDPAFEAAYLAAVEGRPAPRKAAVVRHPAQAVPKSFKAAWRILRESDPEWRTLGPDAKKLQTDVAEALLTMPLVEGSPMTVGEGAVEDLRRRHVKALIARRARTAPHMATHLLRVLRKLIHVAIDQEWIELDPTYGVKHRPALKGWKAWPNEMLDRFEARWPITSRPRLVYSLALYFGHRRSDITRIKPEDFEAEGSNVIQQKTGKPLWIPIHANLREVLEAQPQVLDQEFILMSYRGKPFKPKLLDQEFRSWRKAAGIPNGHSLHGLRKTLGKQLAEHGATTRELMDVLGHDDIEHAELYSREAEQKKLAAAAMQKLTTWRRKPGPG
jgi:integrase